MKKIKKLWQNRFFKNYLLLMLAFTFIEIIFHIIENISIVSYDTLRIWIGINIISCLFAFIFKWLPNLAAKILNLIIILIVAIYGIVELGFHNFLGVYASLQIKTQASAVTSYIWDFVKSFHLSFYCLLIPFILLLLYYLFLDKKWDKKIDIELPRKKINITTIIINSFQVLIIIFLCLIYLGTLKWQFMQSKLESVSTYELFKKPTNPGLEVKKFGIIGFGLLDIKEYFFPGREIDIEINYNPDNIDNNSDKNTIEYQNQLSINNEIWKQLIEEESNTTYNNLNKYFISNEISMTNDYTGYFANKNIIAIMVESGSNLMINKEYYPNLYKLYSEGWSWDNYYSPRTSCSTGNNETSAMTGLYSIYNSCNSNVYRNNTYFESIFNLFNNQGYTTNSFHDYTDAYYYRTTIHRNMGSSKFYKVNEMGIKYGTTYGDWPSDADMMEYYLKILDERDTSKPFMSWITTVTSHQPYTDSCKYNYLYDDLFPSNYSRSVRSYMSKLKVVDDAIGVLLEGLEERGLLEDTVIVLFADHYPYAIGTNELQDAFSYDISKDNTVDQVPFIIYNSKLEAKHFTQYTSYINFTPTIANLFGLDFDSRLYMGMDVLSNEYNSIVVFADGSWKNEVAYYNASLGTINYYTQKTYTNEEILAINEEISLKLKMSSSAIKTNYFNYLNKALSSYTTSE